MTDNPVDVLADALCRQTFIADWHEKAEGLIVDLAVHGWRLVAATPPDTEEPRLLLPGASREEYGDAFMVPPAPKDTREK